MDIQGALTYPTERDDWIKIVLIGGILIFLGVLLIPLFIAYGYLVRTIQESIDGVSTPPAFGDWGSLLVDGLQAWIIAIIYMLVPLIVGAVTVGGSMTALMTGGRAGTSAGVLGLIGGLTLTGVLALLFGYVAIAAIVNFARRERFGAAFDVGELRELALSSEYAIAWLVSIVVFIVSGAIAGIPLIGFIISPFVTFYATVVAGRLWAEGYVSAVGATESTPE